MKKIMGAVLRALSIRSKNPEYGWYWYRSL
jgi:hypothetical protein